MKLKRLTLVVYLFLIPALAFSEEDELLLKRGRHFAKAHQLEFAYMQFRDIVFNYPNSRFREDAFFATGEYFSIVSDDPEAFQIFMQFVSEYPDSKRKIFALGYLSKIAQKEKNETLAEKLKTDIVTLQRVALIFKNSKEYKYLSPLNKQYRAIIQIDKITISCDGQILAEISY